MKNTYVVIMAGGIGSRLWPGSRRKHPKQFIDVLGTGESLLQMTFDRFSELVPEENIFVVINREHLELLKEQLPQLSDQQIMTESIGRNTAPCIAYASYKIRKIDPEARIIVSPADHAVFKEKSFQRVMKTALAAAKDKSKLITLGIEPTGPETGYGYIQFLHGSRGKVKKVKTFTEKPNQELAEKFVESGEYVWNSGIFIWHVDAIIDAFQQYMPDMAEVFEGGKKEYNTKKEADFVDEAYTLCKNISIDYAVMEKSDEVYVVLGKFGWSDLGSWSAVYEHNRKDKQGNSKDGNILMYDASGNFIKVDDPEKLVVVQGLDNYLVIDTGDVLVICPKGDDQMIKQFAKDSKNKWGEKFL